MRIGIVEILIIVVLLLPFAVGCEKDKSGDESPVQSGKKVYYVSNEGAFGFGNGSLSLYYPDDGSIENQVFKKINGRGPGDVVQSVFRIGNKLFIIVNASGKVEVADATTIKQINTIENLPLPRYMTAGEGSTAYLSCWGNGGIIFKLNTGVPEVIDSVNAGNGPEKMMVSAGKLFVCNSGGFSDDSTVTVIDTGAFSVVMTIDVPLNPVDLVQSNDTTVWILCRGKVIYDPNWQPVGERKAAIVRFNPVSMTTERVIVLKPGIHPARIGISMDKKTIYFGGGYNSTGIYSYDIDSGKISSSPFISGNYYGFNVEPSSGDIYCLEAVSFSVSGRLKVFSPQGSKKHEVKTGIGPNGILF